MFKNLYKYRHMLHTLVKQDIRGRYKGSILGFLWTLLNPLLLLLVYSVVFQFIFRANIEHYSLYLFISLMPWTMFTNTLMIGTSSVSNGAGILKKVYFPREVLPLAIVISNVINYLFSLVIIVIALLLSPIGISINFLLLPIIIIVQAIFTYGLTLLLSAANVYIRDVQYMMNPIIMVWFYASPILYNIEMVPEKYRELYRLNPMVPIIEAYQSILYDKTLPDFGSLGIITIMALGVYIVGYLVFKKLEKRFAEEV